MSKRSIVERNKKRERLLSEYKSTIGFLKKRIEKKKINKLYEYLEN